VRGLFLLDPDVVFLNHGSFGACPRPVFADYRRWQHELERNPVEFLARRADGLLDAARRRLAAYVGARPDDLAFVPNATFGLNVLARALRLERGDEVLATDHEYGAADLMWEALCRQAGARYRRVEVPLPLGSPAAVADGVMSASTKRTRVLFVSHITSPTGLILPVRELCAQGRAAGLLTVVDGAHGPGQIPLALGRLGADVYAGNCHKWLCAPKGAGFLHVRREHHDWIQSLVIGWGWREEDAGFVRRNQAQGTRDPAAYLAVPAAIDFQERHGWENVRTRCHRLAVEARDRISELTGLEPLVPSPRTFVQMVSCPLPPCDGEALQRRLYDEHRIEVSVRSWRDRWLLRVSFQGYNTHDDLERLLAALPKVLYGSQP
jgi:isopenicillin-N epimerase